jgi:hypothetical protein
MTMIVMMPKEDARANLYFNLFKGNRGISIVRCNRLTISAEKHYLSKIAKIIVYRNRGIYNVLSNSLTITAEIHMAFIRWSGHGV